jgi:hypothetical protein
MAHMQRLLTNICLGLRRFEAEEEATKAGAEQPADRLEERARKTTLKIANAANRSSWCSCCEMATFIKTGALARKTHRPIAIFLSRPLYLYEQCRRLLQSSHEMLIQAACDDEVRHVDVLCFTNPNTHRALQPVASQADKLDFDRAAQPLEANMTDTDSVASQANDENHSEVSDSIAFDEGNIFGDCGAPDTLHIDAKQSEEDIGANSSAAQPVAEANNASVNLHQILEPCDNGTRTESKEEDLDISALDATTSAHDDWLHRGPLLFDMDFHTYQRFTVRKPRPKELRICDADRVEHVFLFDSHYAFAASHWQQLVTEGLSKLVVMEAFTYMMQTALTTSFSSILITHLPHHIGKRCPLMGSRNLSSWRR